MKRKEWIAFDDYIPSTTTVFTPESLNRVLGQYDILSIFATVDQQDAAGTLTVRIQHSGNARAWQNKNGSAELTLTVPASTSTAVGSGGDSMTAVSLAFVRLSLTFSGGTTKGHVRLTVVGRDRARG
jgi:hypothetical protein